MARLAVVGAGWAGLAAAVQAVRDGHDVSVYEMAATPGGRARTVRHHGLELDNGQHILIGAYTASLQAMRDVGVDPGEVFLRLPLALVDADGVGLVLPANAGRSGWLGAVARHPHWNWSDRWSLLRSALGWLVQDPARPRADTVEALCRGLAPAVFRDLVEPLCVAALNTPAAEASAAVFLRVLRDAVLGAPGGCDLLLPRKPLGEIFPRPAWAWLQAQGARLLLRQRVQSVQPLGASRWQLHGETYDGIVLACPAHEAARLSAPWAPQWSDEAAALAHEPIVTVTLECAGATLAHAMVCLPTGPAQFGFDHGACGGPPGRFTFVVSGAARWLEDGATELVRKVLAQGQSALRTGPSGAQARVVSSIVERRATFRCVAGLQRPAARILGSAVAAADYVRGPYPATLEGAVRAGLWAGRHCA